MAKRRNNHASISDNAWRYLNDLPTDPPGFDDWELAMLESNQFDHETGYRAEDIWQRFREQILADWIRRHPGTRPWCWWRFESGLKHVCRPDPQRPFEIIEDSSTRPASMWLFGRDQDNNRMLTPEEREARRSQIIMDQRAWLAERNLLQPGE